MWFYLSSGWGCFAHDKMLQRRKPSPTVPGPSFSHFLIIVVLAVNVELSCYYGDCLEVVLLTYGLVIPNFVESIPKMAPGFDVGITEANQRYAGVLQLRQVIVSDAAVANCLDMRENVYEISRYYYNTTGTNDDRLLILLYLGKLWPNKFECASRQFLFIIMSQSVVNAHFERLHTNINQWNLYCVNISSRMWRRWRIRVPCQRYSHTYRVQTYFLDEIVTSTVGEMKELNKGWAG